ncbi:MAG: acyl-ACP--UDP-N-acetylglucosamine O-acyltransferase [Lentisphaerae bacterium]|jgi:UDP-N-acetylglucosamine acyltransferase|nr:acyl-ACP--UDP-N-acetylglucosamine O-acyltransferase [Lentisphaerota bacterium]MBT4819232.1 acyl-ACP--UDP-N-acetylglucosamine O-acyltransferase [Lentisphaerota bacterium]MBT5605027.1 acyl-ACP--UDP-N-acetylglucosamine O-acyltransferase [Lentisphaerota bacterium]MBT7054657.1 acyl-ACP--UDP-N-acetylglucosamine O-acyltransferase [Lentisphaerota bacterium]MBT7844686.1 acyl-ACP--UDP-N-acetylglucosamine O-acyltransferase [Lentisphaerota bacterium]
MIHPTAIVGEGAVIGPGTEVGPYAVVDSDVVLGANCLVGPHVHLTGHTTIGAGTRIHTGAVIGGEPQDLHYDGEVTYTTVGENCVFREYVTVNRGTDPGSTTAIGDNVMLMAYTHVAHNCRLSSNVIIANSTQVAGHVQISPRAFISGGVLIHQFVRIGAVAMVSGGEKVVQDVPPYCTMQFNRIVGPNTIGLRRTGLTPESRRAVRMAIKVYFLKGLNRANALAEIRAGCPAIPEVDALVAFLETTERGIVAGGRASRYRKRIGEVKVEIEDEE